MPSTATPSPDSVSDSEFHALLASYPACIAEISDSKGAKPGQETLSSLDQYRYGTALDTFGSGSPDVVMGLDDVKRLVEWKLRHGKFRPTLMKLVSSNEPGFVKDTIQRAVTLYRKKSDLPGALNILTQLKGIGPATASLLLAVHDPEHVVFFADEAFYWLCCNGSKTPVKYNQHEYTELNRQAQVLTKRLGVKAVDVERVAFVLMRQPKNENAVSISAIKPPTGSPAGGLGKKPPAKRKASGDVPADAAPVRRSKRGQAPLPVLSSMEDPLSLVKRGETPSFACPGPIQLTPRFTALKESLVLGKESVISSSWHRLLQRLPDEIDAVSSLGPKAIPTIRFQDTANSQQADRFLQDLGLRGVGIIRGVVPRDTALFWNREAEEYLGRSLPLKSPPDGSQSQDVFWSPAQVSARAHPNLLAAQKFVMSVWKSRDENARVTTNFPISYADRMASRKGDGPEGSHYASVDGGSVERWEPDGYGRAGTYEDIFQGNWEDYNPWESSTRLGVTSDLYRRAGACSIFRMFQGWLALLPVPSGPGSVQVCPLPRHATAYFLLRPFFSQLSSFSSTSPPPPPPTEADDDAQWAFNRPQNSILHGALPSYAQQITPSLHPHLQLDRSLVPVPDLEPGDYLVWHPDLIHRIIPTQHGANHPGSSKATAAAAAAAYIYLPACPLTQTNALYLARQRKAFLHGHPGPDFGWGGHGHGRGESGDQVGSGTGSSSNSSNSGISRQGAQEVGNAGGDDGLRAMGLLPWDEEEADEDKEREVLAMANGILFPDLYDMYE
ncbi:hypothetical protein C7999DRAFT_40777 [Corynascus novoguineensis]|uniref:DUF1479-domain-containing protein n=1 Tax=Corynascus novoguineensis TaxID=1126955 RepID=A0AAN7HFR8_9PEZI|nr:hypothetical protein C7999DRAFT_40777 [Corynascus novoguineensis]